MTWPFLLGWFAGCAPAPHGVELAVHRDPDRMSLAVADLGVTPAADLSLLERWAVVGRPGDPGDDHLGRYAVTAIGHSEAPERIDALAALTAGRHGPTAARMLALPNNQPEGCAVLRGLSAPRTTTLGAVLTDVLGDPARCGSP